MHTNRNILHNKRDSLMTWSLGLHDDSMRNPLMGEFSKRLQRIDDLLAQGNSVINLNLESDVPTANTMMVTFLLNRCEAIQRQVIKGGNPSYLKNADRILYPSLYIACLQNIIRLIIQLKRRLGLNSNDYTATGIWSLMYLKYPAGLTKFFARVRECIKRH
ncbi:hypothetical protein ACFL2S_11035 [Thermodesulfobacteriota bacterium]